MMRVMYARFSFLFLFFSLFLRGFRAVQTFGGGGGGEAAEIEAQKPEP